MRNKATPHGEIGAAPKVRPSISITRYAGKMRSTLYVYIFLNSQDNSASSDVLFCSFVGTTIALPSSRGCDGCG
jgi:hypothetical protein